jgi:hypothetical protein
MEFSIAVYLVQVNTGRTISQMLADIPIFVLSTLGWDGVVTVALDRGVSQQEKQIENPSYPVNASGSRIYKFPVYQFTNDNKYEIGMSWDPGVIVIGEPVNFLINSFDWPSNKFQLLIRE